MADEADLANAIQEQALSAALETHRRNANRLKPTGKCHYCQEELTEPGQLYCDVLCAADHEEEMAIKRRQGVI